MLDARCLLRAIDAVPARKSLKQAWIIPVSPTITLSGLCIHRKAINKDKHLSCGFLFYHGLDAASKAKWFILVYRLGEDVDLLKEGAVMLLFWALRACSYKTKTEA